MGKERDKLMKSLGKMPSKGDNKDISKQHRAKQIADGTLPSDMAEILKQLNDKE